MELLILVFVLGAAMGAGFVAWKFSELEPQKQTWVVDQAGDLSALEKGLNHLSEEGFAIHRIFLFRGLEPELSFAGVIIARRSDPQTGATETQTVDGDESHSERLRRLSHFLIHRAKCHLGLNSLPDSSDNPNQSLKETQ